MSCRYGRTREQRRHKTRSVSSVKQGNDRGGVLKKMKVDQEKLNEKQLAVTVNINLQ